MKDMMGQGDLLKATVESSLSFGQQEDDVFATSATLMTSDIPQGDDSEKRIMHEVQAGIAIQSESDPSPLRSEGKNPSRLRQKSNSTPSPFKKSDSESEEGRSRIS